VLVWDSITLAPAATLRDGLDGAGVALLAFTPGGAQLAVVTNHPWHALALFDWAAGSPPSPPSY